MASGKYQYCSAKILNFMFCGATYAWTQPTNFYIGLFHTAPSLPSTNTGTETPTGGGYTARLTVACGTTNWTAVTATTLANAAAFTYPVATTPGYDSGTNNIVGAGVWDSATIGAGNLYYYGDLTVAKQVNTGDTPSFAVGAFTIQET
jgi:hypothetical protein